MHTISSRTARAFTALALIAIPLAAQSPNDECTGALAIANGSNGPYYTLSATSSAPVWPCGAAGSDLWFFYVPTCNGIATIDTCGSSFDTVLEVFDVCATCPNFAPGTCNDDRCGTQSSVRVSVARGSLFYVRVGGFEGQVGTLRLNVACSTSGPSLADDECAGATTVGLGLNAGFDNLRYSSSTPSWPCTLGGNDRWFAFTPVRTGEHTIHTLGGSTNFDTVLEVLQGPCGCGLASLACNDDSCGRASSVTLLLVANQTYFLRVGGFAGRTGRFDLVILELGVGAFRTMTPGCGGSTLVATGTPRLGGFVGYRVSPVRGSQTFVWAGVVPLSIPLCAGGCLLGCTFDVVNSGSALASPIPCGPELLGAQFFVQGADFGAPGGCAANDPLPVPFALTETIHTTIGA